jgi:hypothetical protein
LLVVPKFPVGLKEFEVPLLIVLDEF